MSLHSRTGYSPICAKNAKAETRASRWSVIIAPPTFMTEFPGQYCHFTGIVRALEHVSRTNRAKSYLKTQLLVIEESPKVRTGELLGGNRGEMA